MGIVLSISKKIRFEVFKRDGFQCQYCGKTPPDVMLEIDHVKPRAKKGRDDINNLVTACFDCNRGKSSIELKTLPNTLGQNFEILREKEEQYREYQKLVNKIHRRKEAEIEAVCQVFRDCYDGSDLTDKFKNVSIKRFSQYLSVEELKEAMYIACNYISHDSEAAIKYFCGVCWNKIKGK